MGQFHCPRHHQDQMKGKNVTSPGHGPRSLGSWLLGPQVAMPQRRQGLLPAPEAPARALHGNTGCAAFPGVAFGAGGLDWNNLRKIYSLLSDRRIAVLW